MSRRFKADTSEDESSDDDDFSSSLSSLSSLNFDKPAPARGGGNGRQRGNRGRDVEALHFRDENPPRKWVGKLESIDTEEAAFELRQQVNDSIMTGSTTRFDPLEAVNDSDLVFSSLLAAKMKEEKNTRTDDTNNYKNMKRYQKDAEIDITSLHFDPILFLSRVHKSTAHQKLETGILKLAETTATRSHNIKKLVTLHFGQFVHCKDTIDLIQALLKPELPPEHARMSLLASRPSNLPWLLNTFSPQQQEILLQLLTHRFAHGAQSSAFTFASPTSGGGLTTVATTTPHLLTVTSTTSQNISNVNSPSASSTHSTTHTPSGSAGSVAPSSDMSSPFAYHFSSSNQALYDKSRVGRLQLVLSTVAEKADMIYSPLLTRRMESDRIRFALTTFRKYRILLELPSRMKHHITNGRVDRLVHDTQRVQMIRVTDNPQNQILHQSLAECRAISNQFAQVLLSRLNDPRHNLYSQQRTMSYLYQLDNIDPTWHYLDRQCMYILNLLDRTYYDISMNSYISTFISIDAKDGGMKQAGNLTISARQSHNSTKKASGGVYTFLDGDANDDEFDEEYDMYSLDRGTQNGPFFAQTVNSINTLSPPTPYFEYQPSTYGNRPSIHNNGSGGSLHESSFNPANHPTDARHHMANFGGMNQEQAEVLSDTFFQEQDVNSFLSPLPLFMRTPQLLSASQAELTATNLLNVFLLHIQSLLKLAHNVGNGSLFLTIKSSSLAQSGSGDVDINQLTLNRHYISTRAMERLTMLIGHLSSKLILYLASLCIPDLDLNEVSGFMTNLLSSTPQKQQQRALDALDLAHAAAHPENPATALKRKNDAPRTPTGKISSDDTSFNRTSASLPSRENLRETLLSPSIMTTRLSSEISTQPMPHSVTFQAQNSLSRGPSAGPNGKKKPTAASYYSSVEQDAVYTRSVGLHTILLNPIKSVLPRPDNDPIQPLPVAPFSHVVLHLLANLILSLINNRLVLHEPRLLDPFLSFYIHLYNHSTAHLLISATVQVATLKEAWILSPTSIFHHNQTTTLPIQFQTILDTYLQSMNMLPTKQLLFRGLLYFNAPPQFTLIRDYTELVLTFADRLHSLAIPQDPTRLLAQVEESTEASANLLIDKSSGSNEETFLKTTTEAVTTTKVITTKTIIGEDGKKRVVTSEEILEENTAPVETKKELTAQQRREEEIMKEAIALAEAEKKKLEKKPLTITRFGRELLSLAEQLNHNEHSSEPYSVGDVVALNAQHIYNSTQFVQSSAVNNISLSNTGMDAAQISTATAAVLAGLNSEIYGIQGLVSGSQLNSPGDDRVILAVLSNCIHTVQTIIPRAWRNLAELIQQVWPAKELFEISFFLSHGQNGGLLEPSVRSQYNRALRHDLDNLKTKYNPTNREAHTYSIKTPTASTLLSHKQQRPAPLHAQKRAKIHTGLTDSDESTSELSSDDSYSDMSTDLEELFSSDDEPHEEINVLNVSPEVWASLSPQRQHYINTSVVGGIGVAMSLGLDSSYRRVQGTFLQLQNILVQRYIQSKTNLIHQYMYDSLERGGINWRKAKIPTHVRDFILSIMQTLVEAKSELILFQNIDVSAIMTSIIEIVIITWVYFVKRIRILSYNAAMQLCLETSFLCRGLNRYTTPYAIAVCQDLLQLLHAYIEETIVTEKVQTTLHGGGALYTSASGDGFDSQFFDAVSRLGMFSTLNKQAQRPAGKVDENTGYELSTSVSPLHSMILQQRKQVDELRAQRRSSQQSLSKDKNDEVSVLQSALQGDEKRSKSERLQAKMEKQKLGLESTSGKKKGAESSSGSENDDDDNDDDDDDDTMFYEEDDENTLIAGVISMRDLKTYTTQQVNKDLMIQFKLHTTHIDIDNLLQQSLWSTRLSFATLRIDAEDPFKTLTLDESITSQQSTFSHVYHSPEEVFDAYFKVRFNASRLRENVRIQRSEEEKQNQLIYEQWIKQNNLVYNTPINADANELYINLSIGQSKKYRDLVSAQRKHSTTEEIRQIITRYNRQEKSTTLVSASATSTGVDSFGSAKYNQTMQSWEENESPPEDFGVKVTRLVTKRKEVVEKQKLPKEKKEKKQKPAKKDIIIERHTDIGYSTLSTSSSEEDEVGPAPVVVVVAPVVEKKVEKKVEAVVEKKVEPAPVLTPPPLAAVAPVPPPTPKSDPMIIEERVIVTTTTVKQQHQLQMQQRKEEEERRRTEKQQRLLQQLQIQSNNLDFLEEGNSAGTKQGGEFDDLDLQAMHFSYKVAKKEKTAANPFEMSESESSSTEEEEAQQQPQRKLPTPPVEESSSSEDIPEPEPIRFAVKDKKIEKKQQREEKGLSEYTMSNVTLQSNRQRRERQTKGRSRQEDSDENVNINLNFSTASAGAKERRTKKVDVSDVTEQQRLLLKQQQQASKNSLKDKIVVSELDIGAEARARGEEDTSKLSFEEKRRRQIKMRIKRTKDGKYVDLDTGEEIDPAMFKKQLNIPK